MEQQRPLRLHFLWLAVGLLMVSLVVYFSLSHRPPLNLQAIKFGDKFSHFFAYGIMMGWFAQIYFTRSQRMWILTALIGLGVTLEFIQDYGGVRTWSIADMLANTLGVILAYIVARGRFSRILFSVEKFFYST